MRRKFSPMKCTYQLSSVLLSKMYMKWNAKIFISFYSFRFKKTKRNTNVSICCCYNKLCTLFSITFASTKILLNVYLSHISIDTLDVSSTLVREFGPGHLHFIQLSTTTLTRKVQKSSAIGHRSSV